MIAACHLLHVGAVYVRRPHTLSVPTLDSSVIMNRQLTLLLSKQFYRSARSELSMGWVNPRVGLGWVGLGWIGLGRDFLIFGGLGWVTRDTIVTTAAENIPVKRAVRRPWLTTETME